MAVHPYNRMPLTKNEKTVHTTGMHFKYVLLSERSDTQKTVNNMIPLYNVIENTKM